MRNLIRFFLFFIIVISGYTGYSQGVKFKVVSCELKEDDVDGNANAQYNAERQKCALIKVGTTTTSLDLKEFTFESKGVTLCSPIEKKELKLGFIVHRVPKQ